MKKMLRRMILALVVFSVSSGSVWAQGRVATADVTTNYARIATVDLRKLFDNYWKRKQADAALKDRAADLDKEDKSMRDDLKKASDDYQKLLADANDPVVSPEERDKRKKVAETKLKSIKENEDTIVQFERQAQTTLVEQRRRMRENILDEIRTVVNAKARSAGFALVVDTAAESVNNTPIILFANGENDLTDTILSQLNAGAPLDLPAAVEKGAKTDGKK